MLFFLATPASIACAQEPTPSDDEVNAIAVKMYCPVCENTPLDVCPTQACRQWREEIRLRLAQGWTEEEILQYFSSQYGARVLAEPPASGLNWLIYMVPPILFLIGALILFRAFHLKKSPMPGKASTPAPPKDEYARRLEEELRKRR